MPINTIPKRAGRVHSLNKIPDEGEQPLSFSSVDENPSPSESFSDEKTTKEFKVEQIFPSAGGIVLGAKDLPPAAPVSHEDIMFRMEWKMQSQTLAQYYLKCMAGLLLVLVLLSILCLTKLLFGNFFCFLTGIILCVVLGRTIYIWKNSREENS